MFEAFAIEVIGACDNITRAAGLLRLGWDAVQSIMARAVERGLARREEEAVPDVGMDEKSFRKGHNYHSLLNDLGGEYKHAGNARKFFEKWYAEAVSFGAAPMVKVADMLKSHLPNILTYFRHRITNAVSEGLNLQRQPQSLRRRRLVCR
jgi:transposase